MTAMDTACIIFGLIGMAMAIKQRTHRCGSCTAVGTLRSACFLCGAVEGWR